MKSQYNFIFQKSIKETGRPYYMQGCLGFFVCFALFCFCFTYLDFRIGNFHKITDKIIPGSPKIAFVKLKESGDRTKLFGSFPRTQTLRVERGFKCPPAYIHPGQTCPPEHPPARWSASFSLLPPLDKRAESP